MQRKIKRKPFAKKSLGQNFLNDRAIVDRIVRAAKICGDDTVVEIGAGRGILTRALAEKARRVIAIEIDRDLVSLLRSEFSSALNVLIHEADALTIDFADLRVPGSRRMKLVANLPYNISTAVLQRLIEHRNEFSILVLMFQSEVVERITARPGNSARGFLTVLVEAFFHVERMFDVPPTAFRPVPKVWSSVVRLLPRKPGPHIEGNESKFERLVSAAFRQKRKTLQNNLRSIAGQTDLPGDVGGWLAQCGIDPRRRAETLTFEEWECLMAAAM